MDTQPPETPTSPRRPHSRALSDASFATATERAHSPNSPRALVHEIDNIKTLISRVQNKPAATGSITAQVFQRNRSTSQEPVSQARIFHELDALKRRVRHVRERSAVRPGSAGDGLALERIESEAESGVESGSEGGNPNDELEEREEELEAARSEVERVKREREEWLEDAERRVDVAIAEKEEVARRLEAEERARNDLQERLSAVERGLEEERAQRKHSSEACENLTDQKKELSEKLDGLQLEVDALQREKQESTQAAEEANGKIADLQGEVHRSEVHAEQLVSAHADEISESERQYQELQVQHNSLQKESRKAAEKVHDLEKAAQEHEAARAGLLSELEESNSEAAKTSKKLEDDGKEIEKLDKQYQVSKAVAESLRTERDGSEKARKQVEEAKAAVDKERSELRERLDAMQRSVQVEKDEWTKKHQAAERQAENNNQAAQQNQRALEKQLASVEARVSRLINERDEQKAAFELAQKDAKERSNSLQEELENAKRTLESVTRARDEDIEESQLRHAAEIGELRAERDRFADNAGAAQTQALQDAERRHEELKQEHDTALSDLRKTHEDALEVLRRELRKASDSHEKEVTALREQYHRQRSEEDEQKREELQDLAMHHQKALEAVQTELVGAKDTHEKQIATLHEQHAGSSRALQHTHDEANRMTLQEHAIALRAVEGKLAEAHDNHRTAVAELERSHAGALEKQRSDHEKSVSEVSQQLAEAGSTHRGTVSRLEQQHQDALTSLQQELSQAREGLTAASRTAESDKSKQHATLELVRGQLAETSASHEKRLAELRATHDRAIADLRRELSDAHQALTDGRKVSEEGASQLKSEHEKSMRDLSDRHEKDRETLKAEHASQVAALKLDSDKASESLRATNEQAVANLRREADDATVNAEIEFESKLSQLQIDREDALERTRAHHQTATEVLRGEHESRIQQISRDHGTKVSSLTVEVDELTQSLARMKSEHDVAFKNLQEENERVTADHTRTLTDTETQLRQARTQHQSEISDIKAEHIREIEGIRNDPSIQRRNSELESLRAQFDKLRAEQKMVVSEKDAELASLTSALRYEHSKALSELQGQHQSMIQEQRNASETEIAVLKHRHEEALARVKSEARQGVEDRIARLEEEHESSVRAALAHADHGWDERFRSQAKAHGEEIDQIHESLNHELQHLQTQLEEASELRHTQMEAADAQNKGALTDLGDKLKMAEQASAELASKHITVMAELSALQARLDAESTGRAEAERSLAQMRKQKFEEDKVDAAASSEDLTQQVAELQAERDSLKKQVARLAETDARDTAAAHGTNQPHAPAGGNAVDRETNAKLEAERQADELARQNEFLVKELESMRMHVNTPLASPSPAYRSEQPGPEKSDKFEKRRSREHIVDQMRTPKQANGGADRPSTARSFEDYLAGAKTELSELGSVITANEALFAQKIQEHVSVLQQAKDQLAAEYKEKFDALVTDKERMDKDVQYKSAEDFARDRQQLAAAYGVEKQDQEASMPTPQKKAFRNAEEQLVMEYNRRIAKRRSKIALRHAEDFGNLTKDYDQQITELLNNKEKLESNLSVEPMTFEAEFDEMDMRSLQLEVQRNASSNEETQATRQQKPPSPAAIGTVSKPDPTTKSERRRSGLPRLSSTPRTPTSIPRAVPFPGNRDSPDATSQPMTPRTPHDPQRSTSERHPPIAQRSLMRAKYPAEGQRSATNPTTAATISPSQDCDEVTEMASQGQQSSKLKKRQLRHSSGMHFANWREGSQV